MGFIMKDCNGTVTVKTKAADYGICDDAFNTLMQNMERLIDRCDATEDEKTKIRKDVYTDVVLPGLKGLYQDALDYILWGRRPRGHYVNYSHHYTRVERDYSDEEEETEDSED